nr:iron-sulfur cluster biosynthesis family protein [Polytomella parva]|eukprot:CAMPEP_0175067440 /NCGR_PEP_ID=MMETSP0052_2-20121109/17101_1 /TAXON_ID=51329 ORGANISM="Polytomella parva, Strain SAG 63-3" /NCGR_SAMPLE_ID=MMETSP0052_2 /ASSEMBLY_ACC=CAM_ASM_000194 /LENGTH=496 /DNA_ID=CAMNT_0016334325 /DNA_START=2834 /DNA_END=4324 /DNA_ORIENTATION=+
MTDLLLCFHPSRRRWRDHRDYYYHAEEGIGHPLSGSNAYRKEDPSKEPHFAQRDSSLNPGKGFVSASASGSESRSADNRQESLSLVAAIFSFVFGDGNPNDKFEETKWQAIADWIQMKNGVVTAEELAPFLADTGSALPSPITQQGHGDGISSPESQDERFVIPALVRFDGRTVVDDHGNLLYVFNSVSSTMPSPAVQSRGNPSLEPSLSSASSSPSASRNRDYGHNSNPKSRVKIHYSEFSGSSYRMYNKTAIAASSSSPSAASSSPSSSSPLPALAVPQRVPLELLRRFSAASVSQCLLAGCMGLASYLGVNWLAAFLKTQPHALHVLYESGLGFVPSLLPFMKAYATFFVLMPLVRAVWIQILNVNIRRRNAAREAALASLKAAALAGGGGEGKEGHGEEGEMSQNQIGRMRKKLREKLEAARQLARAKEEEERQRQREDREACQERVVRAEEEEGEVDNGKTQEDWDRRFEEKKKRGRKPIRVERIPTPSGI